MRGTQYYHGERDEETRDGATEVKAKGETAATSQAVGISGLQRSTRLDPPGP
jgi:hypothetical protein